MKYLKTVAALALLCVCLPPLPLSASQAELLFRAPDPPASNPGQKLLILTLEAGPEGIQVKDALVAPGRAKTLERTEFQRGYFFRVSGDSGETILAGQFEVPWILHGDDLLDESGTIACISVELDRVVFVLKLPWLESISEIEFHEIGFEADRDLPTILRDLESAGSSDGLRTLGSAGLKQTVRFHEEARRADR